MEIAGIGFGDKEVLELVGEQSLVLNRLSKVGEEKDQHLKLLQGRNQQLAQENMMLRREIANRDEFMRKVRVTQDAIGNVLSRGPEAIRRESGADQFKQAEPEQESPARDECANEARSLRDAGGPCNDRAGDDARDERRKSAARVGAQQSTQGGGGIGGHGYSGIVRDQAAPKIASDPREGTADRDWSPEKRPRRTEPDAVAETDESPR